MTSDTKPPLTIADYRDPETVTRLLPHRAPFLFVDRIETYDGGSTIEASLYLSPDMIFFKGHFPGRPVMPGVLAAEALAQSAGLLLALKKSQNQAAGIPDSYYLARTDLKFVRPAYPDETLRLKASMTKAFGTMFLFDVAAETRNGTVVKGTLALAGAP